MDSLTGRLFSQGHEGRLHSATSRALLQGGLEHTTRPMILRQEGARDHTSTETQAFFTQHAARLQGCQRPTASPEYHPLAQLWKKTKQRAPPLHDFPTFEALSAQGAQALLKLAHIPEAMLTLCSLPTALAQAA